MDVNFRRAAQTVGFPPIGKSTTRLIVWELSFKVICRTVALIPTGHLSDAEKLDALRRLDQFRQWHSLDNKRYCLVCGNIISGRQIQVSGGARGNGSLRLQCPTEGCNAIPMDWVLPTDEILARVERMAADERRKTLLPAPISIVHESPAPENKADTGFASRWRKLGFHFKQS